MTIIVEDGSIVTGANSYASIADFYEYTSILGVDLGCLTSGDIEILLLRAMLEIENDYSRSFLGYKVSSTQPLDWPRSDVWINGYLESNSTIPRDIFYGQMNIAIENYTNADVRQYAVKREKLGDMELEYDTSKVNPLYSYSTSSAKIRTYCRNMELVRR